MYSKEQEQEYQILTKELLKSPFKTIEIESIREAIVYHEWKYYVQNNPLISDYEYDMLFKKLQSIEDKNPASITPNSPTQRVSNDLTTDFNSVTHLVPMLSLDNSYNAEDLEDFDKRIKKLTDKESDIQYVVEPKFDGGSVALVYENDQLIRGATRGNGTEGDDITPNIRVMRSVPLKAAFSKFGIYKVELRGEALIRKDDFDEVNAMKAELGEPLFANARNAATGGLRTKNPNLTRDRRVEAFIYQLGYAIDKDGNDILANFENHHESIDLLAQLGFKVPVKQSLVAKNITEVADFCKKWSEGRDNYAYEIDGMVVKVDNRDMQEQCGYTGHHPRWAIAYKFAAKQATTKLLNVEYQVGKIGSITPVAKLEPVQLAGVTVSSVSLHNEEFITQRDLHLGDTVLVERAGDVIPYIVKAMPELRPDDAKKIEFPVNCPINPIDAIPLEKVEGEAAWRCTQCNCGKQDLQRIIYFVSKVGMDVDGFGKSYVEKFFEKGWLRNFADVYRLPFDEIEKLDGFGKKSVEKLRKAIEKSKSNAPNLLLQSLSIHHCGKKASKLLLQQVEHLMDLKKLKEEDLEAIDEIGPVVAKNVVSYFADEQNIDLLKQFDELGVNMVPDRADDIAISDGILSGKTILFTGTLTQMKRSEAQKRAEALGATLVSGVSKKLNILVAGEKAGSKLAKAQKIGTVEIMTEAEFMEM